MFPAHDYHRRTTVRQPVPSSPLYPEQVKQPRWRPSMSAPGSAFAPSTPPAPASFPPGAGPPFQTYSTYHPIITSPSYALPGGPAVEYATSSTRSSNDLGDTYGPSDKLDEHWTRGHATYDTSDGHARLGRKWDHPSALGMSWEGETVGRREWTDGHSGGVYYHDGSSSDGCQLDGVYADEGDGLVSSSSPSYSHSSISTDSLGTDAVDGYAYHGYRTNTTPLVYPRPDHLVNAHPLPHRHARVRAPIPKFHQLPPAIRTGFPSPAEQTSLEHRSAATPRHQSAQPSVPSLSPSSSTHESYESHMHSARTPSSPFETMTLVDAPHLGAIQPIQIPALPPLPPYDQQGLICSPDGMDEDVVVAPLARVHQPEHDRLQSRGSANESDDVDADDYVHVRPPNGLVSLAEVVGSGAARWEVVERGTLKRKRAATVPEASGSDQKGKDSAKDATESDDDDEIKEVAAEDIVKVEERPVPLTKSGQPFKKKGKTITACAECRRLKMRCDNGAPCSSCIARGVAQVCPTGTLAGIKGKRLVTTDTLHLHKRIIALEDALAVSYAREHPSRSASGSSSSTGPRIHPLLRDTSLSANEGRSIAKE